MSDWRITTDSVRSDFKYSLIYPIEPDGIILLFKVSLSCSVGASWMFVGAPPSFSTVTEVIWLFCVSVIV